MNEDRKDEVSKVLDFIYNGCRYDADGKHRPSEERMMKYVWYIGWLEGNILDLFTDEQAEALKERVKVLTYFPYAEEEEEEGSFY